MPRGGEKQKVHRNFLAKTFIFDCMNLHEMLACRYRFAFKLQHSSHRGVAWCQFIERNAVRLPFPSHLYSRDCNACRIPKYYPFINYRFRIVPVQ